MNEEPQQTDDDNSEQIDGADAPGGGAEAGDREVTGPQAPPYETRHSRRRFLILAGALVAGAVGVLELFRRLGASGGDVTGGAAQSVENMFSTFPVNAVEHIPNKTWNDWALKVDGLVDKPLTFDAAAWQALPRFDETVDFHCVEGWSVSGLSTRPSTLSVQSLHVRVGMCSTALMGNELNMFSTDWAAPLVTPPPEPPRRRRTSRAPMRPATTAPPMRRNRRRL